MKATFINPNLPFHSVWLVNNFDPPYMAPSHFGSWNLDPWIVGCFPWDRPWSKWDSPLWFFIEKRSRDDINDGQMWWTCSSKKVSPGSGGKTQAGRKKDTTWWTSQAASFFLLGFCELPPLRVNRFLLLLSPCSERKGQKRPVDDLWREKDSHRDSQGCNTHNIY